MVIARFSYFSAVLFLAFMLVSTGAIWWMAVTPSDIAFAGYLSGLRAGYTLKAWLLALVATPFVLYSSYMLARTLLFRRGRAIWVERRTLYFLNPNQGVTAITLNDIDHFSPSTLSGYVRETGITAHFKNGHEDRISTDSLAETRDVVLARLNDALAANR